MPSIPSTEEAASLPADSPKSVPSTAAALAAIAYPLRSPCRRCGGTVGRPRLANAAFNLVSVRCLACGRGCGMASRYRLFRRGVVLPPFSGPSPKQRRASRLAREAAEAAARQTAAADIAQRRAGKAAKKSKHSPAEEAAAQLPPLIDHQPKPEPDRLRFQLDFDELLAVVVAMKHAETSYGTALVTRFAAIGGARDGAEYPAFVNLTADAWKSGEAIDELQELGIRDMADLRRLPVPSRSVFFAIRLKQSRSSDLIYAVSFRRLTPA